MSAKRLAKPRSIRTEDIPSLLARGRRVFVQAAGTETPLFREALIARPDAAAGVTFTGVFIPGINSFDYAALHPEARMEVFLLPPVLHDSFAAGKIEYRPFHYSRIYDYLAESEPFDLVVIQVSPPDAKGLCSFGTTADFQPAVLPGAHRILAHVNPRLPRTKGPSIRWRRIDFVIEEERELPEFPTGELDAASRAVGRQVANLIEDGDTLQFGIGKVPAAVLNEIGDRRDLGVHSGLVTDELVDLMAKGAITNKAKHRDPGLVITGSGFGTRRLYEFMEDARIRLCPVRYTHSAAVLASQSRFVSINGAVEVDLFGQCNSETVNHRQISGSGGALDFIRGARRSRGGRSLMALPSTTPKGQSRIVARLGQGTPVTVPRTDVDRVVTEHGVAVLRDLSLDERAEALIAIAAPEHRGALTDAWRDLRKEL